MSDDFGYLIYLSLLVMVLFLALVPWAASPIAHGLALAVVCSILVAGIAVEVQRGNP